MVPANFSFTLTYLGPSEMKQAPLFALKYTDCMRSVNVSRP